MQAPVPGNATVQVVLDAHTQPYHGIKPIPQSLLTLAGHIRLDFQNNPAKLHATGIRSRGWLRDCLLPSSTSHFTKDGYFLARSRFFDYWMDDRLFTGWLWRNLATNLPGGRPTSHLSMSKRGRIVSVPAIQRPGDPHRPTGWMAGNINPDTSAPAIALPPPPVIVVAVPTPPAPNSTTALPPVPPAANNVATALVTSNAATTSTNNGQDDNADATPTDSMTDQATDPADTDAQSSGAGADQAEDEQTADPKDTEIPELGDDIEPGGGTFRINHESINPDAPNPDDDNEEEIDMSKPGKPWSSRAKENWEDIINIMPDPNQASTSNQASAPNQAPGPQPGPEPKVKQERTDDVTTTPDDTEVTKSMEDMTEAEEMEKTRAEIAGLKVLYDNAGKTIAEREMKGKEEEAKAEKAKADVKKKMEKKEQKLQELIGSMTHGEKGMK